MTIPTDEDERRHAFELSVAPEAERLYGIAVAILDDAAEAEDAVQETMLAAWRAWLTRICVNRCIRQRGVLRRWVGAQGRDASAASTGTEPDELWAPLLAVQRAFPLLTLPQRSMVVLHLCDGFTVEQCAEFLGCRPGTARSHLGRALSKLRKELADA